MTIINKKRDAKNKVMIYTVKKDLTDEQTLKLNGTLCTNRSYKDLIDHDADVYTVDGELLLRFRKKILPQKNVDSFYENVIDFAHHSTATRGAESGSDIKDVKYNKKIKSNIYGYFDKWTIFQKHIFKVLKIKPPFPVRVTRFTTEFPQKMEKTIPLINNIDQLYKKLVPDSYKIQKRCAMQTAYRIGDTAFTTFTTNVSTQMGLHKDSGNLKESFGNLVVIEKGSYEGCYTCYPQYKVAVDIRNGDFVAMNIHNLHGNTPIKFTSPDGQRLSIVCYLRQGIWEKSKGSTKADVERNISTMRRIIKRYGVKVKKIKLANMQKLKTNSKVK
jgi:hypothetical protein